MKKLVATALLVLFSAFGQQASEEKKEAVPASQRDVRELQQEIERMRREALAAEKNSVARTAAEREKMIKENQVAIQATEANLALKLESISREARKLSDDQLRTSRNAWYVTLAFGGGCFVLLMVIFLLVPKKNSKKKETNLLSLKNPEQEIKEKEGVLIDPDIPDLKAFSARNGGISRIPFVLVLGQENLRFFCTAELRGGSELPLVYFDGESLPVAWVKRRQKAAQLSGKA